MEKTQQDVQAEIDANAPSIRRQAKLTASNAYQRLNLARDQWFINKIDMQALIHDDKGFRDLIDLYIADIKAWYDLGTAMGNAQSFTSEDLDKLTAAEKRGLASSEAIQIMQAQMKDVEAEHAAKFKSKTKGGKSNKKAFQQAREYARSMGVDLSQEDIVKKAKTVQLAQELASKGLDNDPFILRVRADKSATGFIAFKWDIEEINPTNDEIGREGMRPSGLEGLAFIPQNRIKAVMNYDEVGRAMGDVYRDLHARFNVTRGYEVVNPLISGALEDNGAFYVELEVMINKYTFREDPDFGFMVHHSVVTDATGKVIDIDNNVGLVASRLQRDEIGDDRTANDLMRASMMLTEFHKVAMDQEMSEFSYDGRFIREQRIELETKTDLVLNRVRYGTVKDDSTGESTYKYELYFIPSKYFEAYGSFATTRQDAASVEKDLDQAFEQAKLLGEDKTSIQDSVAMDRAQTAATAAADQAMRQAIE